MAWIVLVVSGVLETVWAAALAQSRGFTRLVPSVVFGVALVLSMAGLAYALRSIPVGTGYAVWVGIGAVAPRSTEWSRSGNRRRRRGCCVWSRSWAGSWA